MNVIKGMLVEAFYWFKKLSLLWVLLFGAGGLLAAYFAIDYYFQYTAGVNCDEGATGWKRLACLEEPLNIRNILIGLMGIVSIGLAGWRSLAAERQTIAIEDRRKEEQEQHKIVEARRLDERFADAVKSLAVKLEETSYPAHLGAIISLRDLAIDSEDYTQRCIDIICSCNQWMESYLDEAPEEKVFRFYVDRNLSKKDRIAKDSKDISLYHERRSQQSLKAVAFVVKSIGDEGNQRNKPSQLDFFGKILCGINLKNAKLNNINLRGTILQGANLFAANLEGCDLFDADLKGANLSFVDLQCFDLSSTNLQEADLEKTNLRGANLSHANLQGANLHSAKLHGAHLWGANMQCANLWRADLLGAGLEHVDLQGSYLLSTNLQGANLWGAKLQGAILLNCNLYGAILLSTGIKKIVFHDISEAGHIKEESERDEFIAGVSEFIESSKDRERFISNIKDAWDKTDRKEESEEVAYLRENSVLMGDMEGELYIKDEKKDSLYDFYRGLSVNLIKEFHIPIGYITLTEHTPYVSDEGYDGIIHHINGIREEVNKEIEKEDAKKKKSRK